MCCKSLDKVNVSTLGVKPTLSELERFEEAPEGIDIELPSAGPGGKDDVTSHSFSAGDNVEVSEGELVNLHGKILAIDGNVITVMPQHEDLNVSDIYISLKLIYIYLCKCTNFLLISFHRAYLGIHIVGAGMA
jgi:transcription elongation factor